MLSSNYSYRGPLWGINPPSPLKGRFRRVLADTRREVERELGADDIRRQLHNEAIMKSLQEPQQAIDRVLKDAVDGSREKP